MLAGVLTDGPPRAANAPATASSVYVALGDSYSAGVGTRDRQDDCYRSPYGYPALVADQYDLTLDYQACTGATTGDVRADQLAALDGTTAAVSITIGGNDAGFTDVLTTCALPFWLSDCTGQVDRGLAVVEDELPGRYNDLFTAIRAAAPQATVAVGDYPLLFQGEDCNAATFFSPQDEAQINAATGILDDLIGAEAATYDFRFVEARPGFTGHAICDDAEWINGLSNPVTESYHPNRDGNIGYAGLFGPALTGRPYPAGSQVRTARPRPAPSVRDQADNVLMMRLDSPANLAKARRHGIPPGRIRTLVRMLRADDPATVRSALTALHRLDRRAG
ncbi:SGNH/GDSL hydrolase family protein [Microlunatus sp. Gsoil 973]|uniref:SGNH/GDSL hydrolase family protein n=1 Tax=Microlunatus sp. Gsoil 973 TaxID=2672569 RepID=UPI001E41527D|nr:SGNH/GDSL hydrolase family protein [Microlunatus sp. Gsoil 973]